MLAHSLSHRPKTVVSRVAPRRPTAPGARWRWSPRPSQPARASPRAGAGTSSSSGRAGAASPSPLAAAMRPQQAQAAPATGPSAGGRHQDAPVQRRLRALQQAGVVSHRDRLTLELAVPVLPMRLPARDAARSGRSWGTLQRACARAEGPRPPYAAVHAQRPPRLVRLGRRLLTTQHASAAAAASHDLQQWIRQIDGSTARADRSAASGLKGGLLHRAVPYEQGRLESARKAWPLARAQLLRPSA